MGCKFIFNLLTVAALGWCVSATALDNPANFNFDGVLTDGGSPMTGPVSLKFQIYDPSANCLLFEESHTGIALDSTGAFSVKVGSGSRVSPGIDGGVAWKTFMANKGTVKTAASAGCTPGYVPATNDGRKLRVTVNGSTVLSPDFPIGSVPFATTADTVQGYTPADFLLTPTVGGSNGQVLTLTGSGLNWTTITTNNATELQGAPVSSVAPAAGQVLTWNGTTAKWEGKTLSGSGTVTSIAAGTGLLGGPITTTGSLSVNVGTGANQIVQLNGSAQLPAINGALLTGVNAASIGGFPVSSTAPSSGYVLTWNGSQWLPQAGGGGGDNLGNHIATQNIALGSFWLSNSGASNGLTVASNGAVGIGTSAPTSGAALDIKGSGSALSAMIVPRDTTASRPTGVDGMIRYNTTLAKFEVFEGSSWTNMVVVGTGGGSDNLGNHIATSAILALAGTANTPGYAFSGNTSTGIFSPGVAKLAFSGAGTERMRIDSNGHVGIGTTVPTATLDVFANTTSGSVGRFIQQNASSGSVALQAVTNGFGGALQVGGGGTPIVEMTNFTAGSFSCGGGSITSPMPFTCSGSSPYSLPSGATFAAINCNAVNGSAYYAGMGVLNGGTLHINGIVSGSGSLGSTTFNCSAIAYP